jgi:probable F420-dependent oxidoreductase
VESVRLKWGRTIKFGIAMFPAEFAMRPDEIAVAVEERGFESLFFPEHTHIPRVAQTANLAPHFAHIFDLYVALSYALQATSRLLVGSGVTLVPEHDPFNAAKALASLDVLSGGRLLVGVGAGWIDQEMLDHGTSPARRWTTTVEYIQAIRALWTDEVAEYHGRYVDFGPTYSWPKPHRPGGPPILVGGNGPRVPERTVQLGDEWFPEDHQSVEELAARIVQLQALARSAGRGPIPVSLFGASPDLEHLRHIREIGVHRVVIYASPAERDTVLPYLDRLAALRDALGD